MARAHVLACGFPVAVAPGPQTNQQVVPDGAGGVFVTWRSQESGTNRARVIRLDSNGAPAPGWSAGGFELSSGTPAGLATNPDGGVLVVWLDGTSIWLQRMTPDGVVHAGWPAGGVIVHTYVELPFLNIKVAADGAGGAYVSWSTSSFDPYYCYCTQSSSHLKHFDGAGALTWLGDVGFSTGEESRLELTPGGAGSVLALLREDLYPDVSEPWLSMLHFQPSGTSGPAASVNSNYNCVATNVRSTSNGAGGGFVAWCQHCPMGIYTSQVDATNTLVPGWRSSRVVALDGFARTIEITADGAGGLLIAWLVSGSNRARMIRLDARGAPATGWPADGRVLSSISSNSLRIASDGAGGAFAVLTPSSGLLAQHVLGDGTISPRFDPDGESVCSGQPVGVPSLVADSPGRATVVWSDARGTDLDLLGFHLDDAIGNHPPDVSGAIAIIPSLWPPNHQLEPVTIGGVVDPDGDPVTIRTTAISQDEPLTGGGTGNTCPDAALEADGGASVRLERTGGGNGRVYTISFTADDGQGGASEGSVTVCIPHDENGASPCEDDGPAVNSLGPCKGARLVETEAIAAPTLRVFGGVNDPIRVEYAIPRDADVDLSLFDVAGRRLATIVHDVRAAGRHEVALPGSIGRGVVFVRLRAGPDVVRRSIVLGR